MIRRRRLNRRLLDAITRGRVDRFLIKESLDSIPPSIKRNISTNILEEYFLAPYFSNDIKIFARSFTSKKFSFLKNYFSPDFVTFTFYYNSFQFIPIDQKVEDFSQDLRFFQTRADPRSFHSLFLPSLSASLLHFSPLLRCST